MIGETKQRAIRRFLQIEKRLDQDPNLRQQYADFMQEYLELGHMKCIGAADDSTLDVGKTIRVHEDDTPLQRILWRFSKSEPLQVFELLTVTYGLAPSSFLATRVRKQLALDSDRNYRLASDAVQEDFYMDDFISGAKLIDEAIELQGETQALMAEGGLELRKWCSNKAEVLRNIPAESLGGESTLHFDNQQRIKTLGVGWETGPDQFCIEIQSAVEPERITKRNIFSAIAKLYDPLGLVSPVVAWAKIRMQQLWVMNAAWDDPVPDDIKVKWNEFSSQLLYLEEYKVPRYLFLSDSSSVQFHVFSDASEAGYGACIYARSTGMEGNVKIELIAAKSRVAPLKRITLPRLELCAALLGAKLYTKISTALRMESTLWNRTSEIQKLTHDHSWNHVSGIDNPADHISRGMLPKEFIASTNWRNGPPWLAQREDSWPKSSSEVPSEDLLERRKTVLLLQTHYFSASRTAVNEGLIILNLHPPRFVN
ncbi:uncharacterized protein LOC134290678 [Aedes albopictus]|uniref:Reverse transcriptase/retrotransposon-derived protein RNase H-like domain-containing protein n=1 Tax=Aedes albopictus TaxID=7160 RepID=A0ABM2A6R5_AEDAL